MAAINKRKLLESAQKNLQKGAVDKALKDYQTLLDADPRDANVRLKVGDLKLRLGKTDEAIAAYLKVADQFTRDGFDAKAVATEPTPRVRSARTNRFTRVELGEGERAAVGDDGGAVGLARREPGDDPPLGGSVLERCRRGHGRGRYRPGGAVRHAVQVARNSPTISGSTTRRIGGSASSSTER